ncbi:toprim domain-containing protein [Pseudovibrio sp. SPO723]|uniref:DUF7146 domain-containing protein n=1 Tax=Nesiotobacter zosterae TaxID=392721 RepID=UPI0029C2701D|nr:toprim domain-containing protein [Pseudovibrio sp. SPO723]MDX5592553.1 toprim domain-containing protein [Pseudovibrio sp. SPO723]
MSEQAYQEWVDEARSVPLSTAAEMTTARFKRSGSEFISVGGCPACGGDDRLSYNTAKGVWNCRGADKGRDSIGFLKHVNSLSFHEAVEALTGRPNPTGRKAKPLSAEEVAEREARKAKAKADAEAAAQEQAETEAQIRERSKKLWSEGSPIEGTPAEAYLIGRGIPKREWPKSLRYHHSLRHPSGRYYPALMAQVVNVDGEHLAIWRIYVTPEGKKAPEEKMKLGLGLIHGGAVRLGDPLGGRIAITEGIETGLAVMALTGLPVWPVLARAGFTNVELPFEVTRADIYADNDVSKFSETKLCYSVPDGIRSARSGAERLMAQGVTSNVQEPLVPGFDWLDVLNEVAA